MGGSIDLDVGRPGRRVMDGNGEIVGQPKGPTPPVTDTWNDSSDLPSPNGPQASEASNSLVLLYLPRTTGNPLQGSLPSRNLSDD